ncbi:MAG: hypothetical protein R2805_10345 [Flavobacterium sp.]|uniref:hypothetical protein n=1 Tax=Flavobacterium sp. TaxID=239 RepID=UPI00352937B4
MENNNFLMNPFEYVGIKHNEGLEYCLKLWNEKTTVEQGMILAAQFNEKNNGNCLSNGIDFSYAFINETINKTEQVSFESRLNEYLEKKLITQDGIDFIYQIYNIREDSLDIPEKIKEIEKRILNSNIPIEMQRMPLIYATVTYHSAVFGAEYSNTYSKPWPWKKDGDGALEGFVTGFVGGLIFGGPTMLLGGLVGGIKGAIGGGLGKSLWSWIKSFFTD